MYTERPVTLDDAGTWALRRAPAWVFDDRSVQHAFLYVVAANTRARALYERHGLQLEGPERDGFRNAGGTFQRHDLEND